MLKYHVHVYKVIGKAEVETEASDSKVAKQNALDNAVSNKLNFGESDCRYIAIAFEQEIGIDASVS